MTCGMSSRQDDEHLSRSFLPLWTLHRLVEHFIREHGWGPVLMSDSPGCPGECGSGDQSMATAMANGSETSCAMGVTACHSPESPALHEEATSLYDTDPDSSARIVNKTRYQQQTSGDVVDEEDWGFIAATLAACAPDSPTLSGVGPTPSEAKSSCQEPVGYW